MIGSMGVLRNLTVCRSLLPSREFTAGTEYRLGLPVTTRRVAFLFVVPPLGGPAGRRSNKQ